MIASPRIAAALASMALLAACATSHPRAQATNSPGPGATAATAATATGATGATARPSAAPAPSSEPHSYEAVKAAVDKIMIAANAGDGGTAWDMMTQAGQSIISRADFIKIVTGCPRFGRGEKVLSIALNAGGTTATVTNSIPADRGGETYTWTMVYESGHWRHQPSSNAMEWMGYGADKALQVLHGEGAC